MTYALSENDCPSGKFADSQSLLSSNGINTYYACANADSACQNFASSVWWASDNAEIKLSQNINCGNIQISKSFQSKSDTTVNGNGHTILFDKPSGFDITSYREAGNLIFKNTKIISKTSYPITEDYEESTQSLCTGRGSSNLRKAVASEENVILIDSTIETQSPLEITTKGICYLKRLSGGWPKKNAGTVKIMEGIANISGFEASRSSGADIIIYEHGTANIKGTEAHIYFAGNGTANICADKISISCFCDNYTNATLNSSTSNINICDACKSNIKINYNSGLCSSNIFTGDFWK